MTRIVTLKLTQGEFEILEALTEVRRLPSRSATLRELLVCGALANQGTRALIDDALEDRTKHPPRTRRPGRVA